ncbi:cupin domain-containing protein [Acidimangrovimonas sediminis]|uniref:cupin domain-containing protein n=1 Tax=Acidimangrovimonas sediminis TaxID=2056283 RepID=UPI000C7FBE94|nr:cupin domain-containing protein [Acidimangrovimonas sediminis]
MTTDTIENTTVPLIRDPLSITDTTDWGEVPTMIEGVSKVYGKLIRKGENGESECGLWCCTPGKWACNVVTDEFCHFLEGRATYVHESGEVIEVTPGTAAFFHQGWTGVCTVHETVKKVYFIR